MRIIYLKLENFATIYTAMNKKSIEIDFSKCKNNVVLLVGANGSGKTSILSTLHPFAYSGNMDVRNNNTIILDGEDGLKEIHYNHNDDIYVIIHHYKNTKRGVIVKSFISKNGTELNPNGNVTSFNDTVHRELSIEQDYLKLLRLGSNVTNMIEMKSSERKRFTSDLLSDIDIYNKLYKKINDDSRILKGMIKSVSDKIHNLKVKDKDDLMNSILLNEYKITELNEEKSDIDKELGFIDGMLQSSFPDGEQIFLEEYKSSLEKLKAIDEKINNYQREIDTKSKKINYIDGIYKDTQLVCNEKYTELKVEEGKLELMMDKLNDLMNQLSSLEIEYDKVKSSDKIYNELVDNIKVLENRISKYSTIKEPQYTIDNVNTAVNLLREIDNIIDNIQEFGEKAANKVIDLIEDRKDPIEFINNKLEELNKTELAIKLKKHFKSSGIILYKPNECKIDCPMVNLYESIMVDNDNLDNEYTYELLDSMKSIAVNINYISMLLNSNSSVIEKFELSEFKYSAIYKAIRKGKKLFNNNIFDRFFEEINLYNAYIGDIERLNSYKMNLKEVKSTSTGKIKDDIEKLNNKIDKEKALINSMNKSIESKTTVYNSLNNLLKQIEEIENLLNTINDFKRDSDKIKETISKNKLIIESNKDNMIRKKSLTDRLNNIDIQIKSLENELFNSRFTLKQYNAFNDEKDILNKKFDKISVIRESLSSTKGIPLIFIQIYLKNTKMFVNGLLESVYGDDFQIDDFDINADEFNIPYIKNGIRISDICYASQGESSFLSVALSFALINQSIKNYNILLLDEIDSTLDIKNRASFLNILERQMGIIDAEQIFLITHNNMFDNYPVDLILTSDVNQENFMNANIIYSV